MRPRPPTSSSRSSSERASRRSWCSSTRAAHRRRLPATLIPCVGISGPIVAINAALDPEIDAVITGHTHLPYNCLLDDPSGKPRIVTSAYSYGRVVSEINLMIDKRSGEVRRNLSTATNHIVVQADLKPDQAPDRDHRQVAAALRCGRHDPGRHDHGRHQPGRR